MDILQAFGTTIREIRQEKNLTQAELAAASSLDESYISGIERAIKNPSLKVIQQLATAFNMQSWMILRMMQDKM